jgi:hypothetical protein
VNVFTINFRLSQWLTVDVSARGSLYLVHIGIVAGISQVYGASIFMIDPEDGSDITNSIWS